VSLSLIEKSRGGSGSSRGGATRRSGVGGGGGVWEGGDGLGAGQAMEKWRKRGEKCFKIMGLLFGLKISRISVKIGRKGKRKLVESGYNFIDAC